MFKKLILGITLVSAMVACTDDYTDWPAPQQNPQPETATFGNGSVAAVNLIDFAKLLEEDLDSVQVCTIQAPTSSDAAYASPYYLLHLGESVYEIGASGKMAVADLKYYIEANYGKAPYEREIEATVEQWISNGTTSVKTATSAPFVIKAKLLAPELYPNLYLIGAPSEWNPTCTAMPFAHSDKNVYDDPVFTITFPVTDGDCWFAFADDKTVETADWNNVFGALEGNGMNLVGETGHFDRRSALTDEGSFKVSVAGDAKYVKFTVDVLNSTYLIEKISYGEYIYFIGATDGWSQAAQKLQSPANDGVYTGFVYCADPNGWGNQFKFQTVQGSWDGEINSGHFTAFNDAAVDCGGNIGVSGGENVYYFVVDLPGKSITATEVKTMGIIGDFNGWGGDVVMTWNAEEYCYEATNAGLTANGWKFRVNNDWALNLGANGDGANIGDLCANGANISVAGNTVKLYPTRKTSDKIFCTVE